MKVSFFIFWLFISFTYGCKVNKNFKQHEYDNGLVTLKYKLNGGDHSSIGGQVKEIATGEPIPNASVIILKDGRFLVGAKSNGEGNFMLKNIPNGKYFARIETVGYKTVEFLLDLDRSNNVTINAQLSLFIQQVEKPVIYLYPTEKQAVHVSLHYNGNLIHSYPAYPVNGWDVIAEPNGVLTDKKGMEYYALFWEGKPFSPIIPKDGFVVPGNITAVFLEEKLAYLGLNRREANEFIMYWLPEMENNPYNLIHFSGKAYEEQAGLVITPEPETIIRVMMLTSPLKQRIEFPLQNLKPLQKTRKGFVAVEWGGSVIQMDSGVVKF